MMTDAPAELYDTDFYVWTQRQADGLRRLAASRPNLPLDLDHIAEEIEDLGKDRRDALRSWTRQIIMHLLLLEHSPARDPRRGWGDEIGGARDNIADRITATLRHDLDGNLSSLYRRALDATRDKLERYGESDAARSLPERCPYTLDQILDRWWPDDGAPRT